MNVNEKYTWWLKTHESIIAHFTNSISLYFHKNIFVIILHPFLTLKHPILLSHLHIHRPD